MTIDRKKFKEKVTSMFPSGVKLVITDKQYAFPSSDFLFIDFKLYWLNVKSSYSPKEDCEDQAFAYLLEAQRAHRDSEHEDDGFAVGVCFYLKNGERDRGHGINFALLDGESKPRFIEPQTGNEIILTVLEWNSIFFVCV